MANVVISTAGMQGPRGNTWWPTDGPPADSLGVDGDYALDQADPDAPAYYGPKTNNTWTGTGPYSLGGSTAGLLEAANNLSDVDNPATARANLGLGSAATQAASAFDAAGAAAGAQEAAEAAAAASFQPLQPWVFNVTSTAYGAKGDGRITTDGAMSISSNVLTCASAPFASGDVGKAIQVKGAGPTGVTTLVTTISSYTSPTSVTLAAANASGSSLTGLTVLWATDDTAAIQSAISAAVAYAQGHGGAATVLIPAAAQEFYGIAGALNTSESGNAQLTLPVVATTGNKIVLTFQGAGDGAAEQHWQQIPPQMSGSTLVSFGVFASTTAQANSISAHGNPALLGGPSEPGGYGVSPGTFTNIHVVLQGISLRTVHTAWGLGYTAVDLDGCANAALRNVGYGTLGTVGNADFGNPTLFGTGLDIGLLLPSSGNNDLVILDNVTCFGGYTYGAYVTEHTDMLGVRILYCWAGLCPVGLYYGSVGSTHAIRGFVSVEACHYQLYLIGAGSGGVGPFLHLLLDTEGTVMFGDNGSGTPSASAKGTVTLTGEVTFPISLDHPIAFDLINDQVSYPTTAVSSNYTVQPWDEVIEASGTITITAPSAATRTKRLVVVNTGTGTITIEATGGQLISGSASKTLTTQWSHAEYAPSVTGTSWNQIG